MQFRYIIKEIIFRIKLSHRILSSNYKISLHSSLQKKLKKKKEDIRKFVTVRIWQYKKLTPIIFYYYFKAYVFSFFSTPFCLHDN